MSMSGLAAAIDPYPLEYFALREVMRNVNISPDGKHLLLLATASKDGNAVLEVYDAANLDKKPFRVNADPMETLVPQGRYRMSYLGHDEGNSYGRPVWFVRFQITEPGGYEGRVVLRFYNIPKGARLARSSNLAIDFINLTGLRPPATLTPDWFLKGCEVLGKVVTVRERVDGRRRIQRPETLHYSKVDELLKITAGSPPCMAGRPQRGRASTSTSASVIFFSIEM